MVAQDEAVDRIVLLDTLRGFAVLGIFFVNIIYFGQPYSAYSYPTLWGTAELPNTLVWAINNLLVEDSMRALFVMLFGASAVMLLSERRLSHQGVHHVEWYFRRNLWLMAFGLVHGFLLLSPHDVLYAYGLLGLLLFPLRQIRPLVLAIVGSALLLIAAFMSAQRIPGGSDLGSLPLYEQRASEQQVMRFREGLLADMQDDMRLYHSSYPEIFAAQKKAVIEAQSIDIYQQQGFILGGFMLLGMALFKWRVLTGERSRRFYLSMMLTGYAAAGGLRVPALLEVLNSDFNPFTMLNQFTFGHHLSQLPLALGHIGMIALLASLPGLHRLTRSVSAVGRMALTHYIGQSVFSILFFFGFGLALFGTLERYQLALVYLAVMCVQLILSLWWLNRFRYGPLESVWRRLTLGVPFRSVNRVA